MISIDSMSVVMVSETGAWTTRPENTVSLTTG